MGPRREWFRFEAKAQEAAADIYIFSEIGESFVNDNPVTAKAFVDELAALPKAVRTIRLHVNSTGGDVFEATVIANHLLAQRTEHGRKVVVSIEGIAASAATIITCAGDPIRIAENALMMIHNPWTIAVGNAQMMREMASALDKIRDTMLATYQWVSPKSREELSGMMDATTWLDAHEAVAAGFAHEIVSDVVTAAASLSPTAVFAKLTPPDVYRARVDRYVKRSAVPAVAASADVMRLCLEAELDLPFAQSLLETNRTLADIQNRIDVERAARTQEARRAHSIRAVCRYGHLPELADGYINGGMQVDHVKSQIVTILALLDRRVEIDGSLEPDHETHRGRRRATSQEIYDARNKARGVAP